LHGGVGAVADFPGPGRAGGQGRGKAGAVQADIFGVIQVVLAAPEHHALRQAGATAGGNAVGGIDDIADGRKVSVGRERAHGRRAAVVIHEVQAVLGVIAEPAQRHAELPGIPCITVGGAAHDHPFIGHAKPLAERGGHRLQRADRRAADGVVVGAAIGRHVATKVGAAVIQHGLVPFQLVEAFHGRFGGQVMDTMDIENFTTVQKTVGPQFAQDMEAHVREYGVDIMNLQRVSKITGADQTANGLVEVELENGAKLESKTIILSTGARWREMNVPGEAEYRTRGVAYCPHCDGPLFKGKRVAVIGGGNSGVEAAIDLAGIVEHVTLVEFDTKLRADQVLQDKLNSLPNTTVILNALSTEVVGDGSQVTALKYKDRATDIEHTVELAGIFVQIGLLPNTDFLKNSAVELSNRGEIMINDRNETNVKGVFAAGDCTTVPYKQIIIATGEGAKASLSAFDYMIRSGV